MRRRNFLLSTLAGLAGAQTTAEVEAQIELSPQNPGAEISPNIYGHFIEHLGGVIYDGIWVGADSKIPNIGGIRKQFVDDMKRISAPNLRWPGGCFADGYHWRDGIGPLNKRPRTYNYWQYSMPPGLDHTETNQFGIHEFMRLCRLIGAEPYLAANLGSGTPREFHDWVSYCNAPTGTVTLADERAANGDKAPFGVSWWGVGNESWGCGGDMTPAEYATLYRRFVTQFPVYAPRPHLVATGPRGHSRGMDLSWTTGFFEAMQGHHSPVDGFSLHFYTDFRNGKGRVNGFDATGWYDVIREGMRTEQVIEGHWKAMGEFDPERRTKLVIDEWGVWYSPGDETSPGHILSQPLTMRDAVHTAVTFDVLNRHSDKVSMANVAQTINCLHSLFLTEGDKYVRTPVYSVFEMYRPHMGGRAVPLKIRSEELSVPSRQVPVRIPGLSGSASLRDNGLNLTLTNVSLDASVKATIRLASGSVAESRGQVLTHPDMRAHNRFDKQDEVHLAPLPVIVRGAAIEVLIPRQAVAALRLRLS
jgi:alpha-L-arabinofuranosidase